MRFPTRPSKAYLYEILDRTLSHIRQGVGVDAASADLKNRESFKTDSYYGLDIQLSLLKKGLAKNHSSNTYGIVADLCNLRSLTENSASAVVSTNTLYCLDKKDQKKAIAELIRITAPGGMLFLELPIELELTDRLGEIRNQFENVRVYYYKNTFSRAYESLFERNGYLGSHPLASQLPFRLIAWLISRLEYLTCYFPSLNKHVIIIAKTKKDAPSKKSFTLANINQLSANLYSLIPNTVAPPSITKKPSVLIIITKAEVGGAQVSVFNLARALTKNGAQVTVGFGPGEFLQAKLAAENIPTIRFNNLSRSYNPLTGLFFAKELTQYLNKNSFDVIHFNSSNSLFGAWGAKWAHPKPRTVFTFRGLSLLDKNFTPSKLLRIFYRTAFKILLRAVDAEIFVSQSNQDEMRALGIAKNDTVIYNGLAAEKLEFVGRHEARAIVAKKIGVPLENKLVVGSIGRLSYQKNYLFFISAFKKVVERFPNAIAVIIGDGPERQQIERAIETTGLLKNIFLLGEISDGYRLFKAFDIFALPSRYEGLSVTLIEALYAGATIVASDVGGNKEIVGSAGILYSHDNEAQFHFALFSLLENEKKRAELGAAALNMSKQFDIEKTAIAYEKVFFD